MKKLTCLLPLLMLLVVACASQRVEKAHLAQQFDSVAKRAEAIAAQQQVAYDAGLISRVDAARWNAWLFDAQQRFATLVIRFNLATPDEYEAIARDLALLADELEGWALSPPATPNARATTYGRALATLN